MVADARSADKQDEASKWAWLAMLSGKEGRGQGPEHAVDWVRSGR